MDVKCFICGADAVYARNYYVQGTDRKKKKNIHLSGAATLGLCPHCLREGYKMMRLRPLIRMILWVVVLAVILIFDLTSSFTKNLFIFAACTGLAVYDLIRIIFYSGKMHSVNNIKKYLSTLTPEEYHKIAELILQDGMTVFYNVIFSFDALKNTKASRSDLRSAAYAQSIRVPFEIHTGKQSLLTELPADAMDNPPPYTVMRGEADEKVRTRVFWAVRQYLSEENGTLPGELPDDEGNM